MIFLKISAMNTPKRNDLTVAEKINLLQKYDTFAKISQREAALKLEISQSLLNKLLKNRHDLEISALNNENVNRK